MNDASSFGSWVKQQRTLLDLTREELAEQVGCAVETVRKIERDQRRPSKQIAERLAAALVIAAEDGPSFFQRARTPRAQPPVVQPPLPPAHSTLPEPLTTLFGRDPDVAAVCAILQRSDVRLLTLLGPPGVGKTRLSLEVGRAQP